MKVKNVYWFTTSTTKMPIGIVTGIDEIGRKKAYIGIGLGINEKEDIEQITSRGGKISAVDIANLLDDLLPPISKDSG